MGRIPPEQPHNLFFSRRCKLSRYNFQQHVILQKAIAPEPWLGWGQVITRSKSEDVIYLFGIRLLVRFQIEQHQISVYWLLLAVKSEFTSLSKFFFMFRGNAAGLKVAICYGSSKSYASTHNIANNHRILFVIVPGCGYASEQDLNQIAFLADFSSICTCMRIVNSAWRNLIIEEDWCFIALKPIMSSSYLKPCQFIVLSDSFQGCLLIAHFCQPWARWRYPW
jgi:hypothetical protein